MSTKRILALLLAGIMTSASLISCGEKKTNDNDNTAGATTDPDAPQLELPTDVKGGGEDFDIFLAYSVFDADYIVKEETGDTIKDIIFQRNAEVENYFDINFQFRKGDTNNGTATPIIRSLVQGGDDTYEVFMNVQHIGMPLIYENLFVE